MNNKLSGNVVDLCPVGALGDKDFLYQQRVWFLRRHRGVCTGCATGCSIWIEENQDRIYRIKPRENPFVNKWWICNDGRYDYPPRPQPASARRSRERRDGRPAGRDVDWTGLPGELRERLHKAGRLAACVSPYLTVEEAYLLCQFVRSIDAEARAGAGAGADAWARTSGFPRDLRSRRKSVQTAAASRRLWPILPTALTTFDAIAAGIGPGHGPGRLGVGRIQEPTGSTKPRPGDSSGWGCWSCRTCFLRR